MFSGIIHTGVRRRGTSQKNCPRLNCWTRVTESETFCYFQMPFSGTTHQEFRREPRTSSPICVIGNKFCNSMSRMRSDVYLALKTAVGMAGLRKRRKAGEWYTELAILVQWPGWQGERIQKHDLDRRRDNLSVCSLQQALRNETRKKYFRAGRWMAPYKVPGALFQV